MLYAIINNERKRPEKGLRAKCPYCGEVVLAKCGEINIHHWAHVNNSSCPMSNSETEWHYEWKSYFHECNVEKRVTKKPHGIPIGFISQGNKYKIADIKIGNQVIEIQHSSISSEEIIERNNFYKKIIWIFDCRGKRIYPYGKSFNWKYPSKRILNAFFPDNFLVGAKYKKTLSRNGRYYYNIKKERRIMLLLQINEDCLLEVTQLLDNNHGTYMIGKTHYKYDVIQKLKNLQ